MGHGGGGKKSGWEEFFLFSRKTFAFSHKTSSDKHFLFTLQLVS